MQLSAVARCRLWAPGGSQARPASPTAAPLITEVIATNMIGL